MIMDRGLVDVGCRPLTGGVPVLIQVQWPPHRPPQIESVVKAPRCRTQTQQERRRRTLPAYGARGRTQLRIGCHRLGTAASRHYRGSRVPYRSERPAGHRPDGSLALRSRPSRRFEL